ncbi:hypothetical protein CKN63_13200 [Carnobacterium divergens]|uniref:hypothetical protein n=3 Tax=Carnobacterium divergens TaxID=2748 RepID=UPI001071E49F|nr:hypothetical protein [Carnobacterium divergens]TFJ00992.1 hypothetical protein CKN75_12725 [Carnobacterium divergens]TFJ08912.1 hypothetical protein CKN71_12740 [Carnobacterium divergens]TFJ15621.1 hypothetical protein CKN63_13200 [Carnobacterium divergens]
MFISKRKYVELKKILNSVIEESRTNQLELESKIIHNDAISRLNREIENTNQCIMGIEKNKIGDILAVVTPKEQSYEQIMLYSLKDNRYKALNNHPRLYARQVGNDTIKIDDIFSQENIRSSGNGTILLSYLKKEAIKHGYTQITGWLSSVDKTNFEKLEYFYKKNGFNVLFSKDGNNGKIYLKF